jgi:hypothetical protein
MVGSFDNDIVGAVDGMLDGCCDGATVGLPLGNKDGPSDGITDGCSVGILKAYPSPPDNASIIEIKSSSCSI